MADQPRLRLYNTLTRTKEVFEPIDPANVRMYVCGPTVYDFAHIGNARPVIVFDVLFRLLRHLYGETHVTYTRNITDVDDKINARAVRDFPGLPLNEAIRKVTETTAAQFQADADALGCLRPTHQPRATEHIGRMAALIGRLLDRGCAYIAHGAEGREVLFDVARMPSYGRLSNRRLEEQREGARVAVEPHKRNPADFVLWKESDAREPGWEVTFRTPEPVTIFGRPGWHIECSAMSMATLLEPFGGGLACDDPLENTFDIHAGGLDLIFPHHENEIAQSACALGTHDMARVWMHNGFLQVEGQKMSKSLGNFVTIHDLLETEAFGGRSWPGEVLRLAMLKTHYRQPIDWTIAALEESEAMLEQWRRIVWDAGLALIEEPVKPSAFLSALTDDLNTPGAIAALHQLAAQARRGEFEAASNLASSLWFLGFKQNHVAGETDTQMREIAGLIDREAIDPLITARLAARRAKNFAESDRIRDELAAMGIQLKDGKDALTGEPTTTWEVKR